MKIIKKVLSLLLVLFVFASPVEAKNIGGVTLPDSIAAGDTQLSLNGAGLRKKLFIKVYAGGLYLKHIKQDAQAIIMADEPMAIRMHFIYDGVAAEKLIEAWNEGFENATRGNVASIRNEIDQFNAMFTGEAKENDIYDIAYTPESGVQVSMNGQDKGTIKGLAFKQALFGIWLSDKPADKSLKRGMLGN